MKSSTRHGPGELGSAVGPDARNALGRIRRMAISTTARMLWRLLGHSVFGEREEKDAEVFAGAGFTSRPGGRNAEAIVLFLGEDATSPVVVAIRDEQMRAAIVGAITGGLKIGESVQYSGSGGTVAAMVHCKDDGTVEVRRPGHAAVPLITFAEFMRHVHLASGSNTGTPITAFPPALSGTVCIKGE